MRLVEKKFKQQVRGQVPLRHAALTDNY